MRVINWRLKNSHQLEVEMRVINDKEIKQVSGGVLNIVTNAAAAGMPVSKPTWNVARQLPGSLSVRSLPF